MAALQLSWRIRGAITGEREMDRDSRPLVLLLLILLWLSRSMLPATCFLDTVRRIYCNATYMRLNRSLGADTTLRQLYLVAGVPSSLGALRHIQDRSVPACNWRLTPSSPAVYGPYC